MRRQRDVRLRVTAVLAFLVAGSTAVSADCRGEVEAAFQRLEMPDRPYRSENTFETYRETTEFIPPDRMRTIVDYPDDWMLRILEYFTGQGPFERIQIGNRMWMRENKTWVEYPAPATLPPEPLPPETTFVCLEAVAFEGKTYAGYRMNLQLTRQLALVRSAMNMGKIQQEEALKALKILKEAPTTWRTILVDRETGLPAYDIMTPTNSLDGPTSKTHYMYPRDLTIEPPVQ
jgi:hypothetical protein